MIDTESLIETIQTQIEELKKNIATPVDIAQLNLNTQDISLLKQVLGITETSTPVDISILGKLTAEKTETGALIIKVTDESAPTIGEAVILAGETSVTVETGAAGLNSKIFVTAKTVSDQPLAVTTVQEGLSFKVETKVPVTEDVSFNWWIVEKD